MFCFVDAATDLAPEAGEPQSTEGKPCVEPLEVKPSSSDTEDTEVTKLSDSWLKYKWAHPIENSNHWMPFI